MILDNYVTLVLVFLVVVLVTTGKTDLPGRILKLELFEIKKLIDFRIFHDVLTSNSEMLDIIHPT